MEVVAHVPVRSSVLAESQVIPIASLDPLFQTPPASASVKAVVALIWPYSSSTESGAVLLAEPDFRLRKEQGQVRIQLKGPAARAVGKSGIGIGDEVQLALENATWATNITNVHTPGLSLEGELLFDHQIILSIYKDGVYHSCLEVNEPRSIKSPATPSPKDAPSNQLVHGPQPSVTWSSPAFLLAKSRNQQSQLDSNHEVLNEEDEFADERARKRVKLWRSSDQWRYVPEAIPSPEHSGVGTPNRDESSIGLRTITPDTPGPASPVKCLMPVDAPISGNSSPTQQSHSPTLNSVITMPGTNALPPLTLTDLSDAASAIFGHTDGMVTPVVQQPPMSPQLRPVQSPGLPLVSPLTVDARISFGYQPDTSPLLTQQVLARAVPSGEDESSFGLDGTAFSRLRLPLPPVVITHDGQHSTNSVEEVTSVTSFANSPSAPAEISDSAALKAVDSVNLEEAQTMHSAVEDNVVGVPVMEPVVNNTANCERDLRNSPTLSKLQLQESWDSVDSESAVEAGGKNLQDLQNVMSMPNRADTPPNEECQPDSFPQNLQIQQEDTQTDVPLIIELSSDDEENLDVLAARINRAETPDIDIPEPSDPDETVSNPSAAHVQPNQAQYTAQKQADELKAHAELNKTDVAADILYDGVGGTSTDDERRTVLDTRTRRVTSSEDHKNAITEFSGSVIDHADAQNDAPICPPGNGAVVLNAALSDSSTGTRQSSPSEHTETEALYKHHRNTEKLLSPAVSEGSNFSKARGSIHSWGNPNAHPENSLITPQSTQHELEPMKVIIDGAESRERTIQQNTTANRTTPKKQTGHRSSEVPAIISPWFISRRTAAIEDSEEGTEDKEITESTSELSSLADSLVQATKDTQKTSMDRGEQQRESPIALHLIKFSKPPELKPASQPTTEVSANGSNGRWTSLAYYTPLSALQAYMNVSLSQTDTVIDVLAVTTSPTSQPVRAKAGPRDHFTIMHVSDVSVMPRSIEVHVFRRWKKSLPVAEVGNVILLRNFVVRSKKRQCYLISGDVSAWHVWKFHGQNDIAHGEEKLLSTKTLTDSTNETVVEECRGPPVEIGHEEQEHATALRRQWKSMQHGSSQDATSSHHERTKNDSNKEPVSHFRSVSKEN